MDIKLCLTMAIIHPNDSGRNHSPDDNETFKN